MTLWIINLTSTHSKLSKNLYVYCVTPTPSPSSLFTMIFFFLWAKTASTACSTGAKHVNLWHLE